METTKEHFEKISKAKEYTFGCIKELRRLLQLYLDEKKIEYIDYSTSIFENEGLFLCSEVNHLRIIFRIIRNEISMSLTSYFTDGVLDVQELLDKYFTTIFFLRRIELGVDENGIIEATDYIADNNISIASIVVILKENFFMDESGTALKTFHLIEQKMPLKDKKIWINVLANIFELEEMYIRMSSEYLDSGFINEAYNTLLKVKQPSKDTVMLIEELEKIK